MAGRTLIRLRLAAAPGISLSLTTAPAAKDPYANIHSVGIISAIGDCLVLRSAAGLFPRDAADHLNTSAWGIDEMVVRDVSAAVSARFEVRPVVYKLTPYRPCEIDVEGPAIDYRQHNNIDAYIIVHKWAQANIFTSNSSLQLVSLGLYRREAPLLGTIVRLHAFFQVAVVDRRTMEIIDYGSAMLPGGTLFMEGAMPVQRLDPSIWPEVTARFGDEQRDYLRTQVTALVRASLIGALIRANVLAKETPVPPLGEPQPFRPVQ